MDIAAWLRELGLGQYAAAFRDNAIDAEVLPRLTLEDLKELGVIPLGHRRRLLDAIAVLSVSGRPAAPPPRGAWQPDAEASSGAERRQLTVLFCDLAGSTALAARLDPEDLREVIGAYHEKAASVIALHGGYVAKYMGDGVLAYFGYPQAHEADAERAVRAGLALAEAVARLPGPEKLRVRVGIATGTAVVGDLIGAGAAQERGVVGETPNLAARLQALAPPDGVVIAASTRALTGGLFEYDDFGPQTLKGLAGPVSAWRVRGESAVASRFEALRAGGSGLKLVGREEELDVLRRRWRRSRAGEGQVVLLAGEAGIGKSRLIAALQEAVADEAPVRLSYFCSPHHQDSALHPVITQLQRAAGFQRGELPEARWAKLEALLAPTAPSEADVALLGDLLSIPGRENPELAAMTPQKRRERTTQALLRQLAGLARQGPVLALFEDLHWADPSTRDLLDRMVGQLPDQPVLLVLTFRPEFQPPWAGLAHISSVMLNRLDRRASATLVRGIADQGQALPPELIEEIVSRTDGVPLFLEELTKAVLESGTAPADAQDLIASASPASFAVPATLHASLMARLDRLGPSAKEVAQIGAALGREFSYELFRAVALTTDKLLDEQLERLVVSELVLRRGSPPDATYAFKHALVQDAAYGTLLRSDRRRLHARIAEAVEGCFPERVAREPELLAHHFAEAGQAERAVNYWLKAGERAAERSANLEATRHLTRGLEALRMLPEGADRDRRELALQIAIGTPLIAVQGYSAPQTGAAYGRARALCEQLDETEPLVSTLSGEFVHHFVRGDYPMMRRLAGKAQQVSKSLPSPVVRLASHRLAGITAMHFGVFPEARSEFDAILRLYDAGVHRSQPVHYVHDPKVSALTYLVPVLWILGFPEQARRSSIAAFQCAAELDQANLNAHVHNFAGAGLDELLGDVASVRSHADAIIALAERHSLHYWRLNGLILRGWVMAQEGAVEAGIALMRQNADDRAALGVGWNQARYLCMLAATYGQVGQAESGLRVIAEAKTLAERNEEHMWEGELDRVEGELRQMQGESASDVEACFATAITVAREQDAKSFELRAATSLARLWREQGHREKARGLLTPIYGWFTEGFGTPDLRDAKTLLNELTAA